MGNIGLMMVVISLFSVILLVGGSLGNGELSSTFYDKSCPNVTSIIRQEIEEASLSYPRIGAVLLRIHFHDCFVNGCDASVLLDSTATFESEKATLGNSSTQGFQVIDKMKAILESVCPGIVSCADILTIAAEESVNLADGPSWTNLLGRRDGTTANLTLANYILPNANDTLDGLKSKFSAVGLDNTSDLVALSGGHTFGQASCQTFISRLYNFSGTGMPDPTLNTTYLRKLRDICPQGGNGSVGTNLDVTTPTVFDKYYFSNLLVNKGLLQSDQELFSTTGVDTIHLVTNFSHNQTAFFESFIVSMIRMGNLDVLTGTQGEIRSNCSRVNGDSDGVNNLLLASM